MKRHTKLKLLNSDKPTKYVNKGYNSDEEIEALFEPLIRELNKLIQFTIQYKHGGFRFRVIVDSDQIPAIMVADVEWDKKFGRDIRRICTVFNIKAVFQEWAGFYMFYPMPRNEQYSIDPEYDGAKWIARIPYAIDNHKYKGR